MAVHIRATVLLRKIIGIHPHMPLYGQVDLAEKRLDR
jgi:hypothetical protein